MPRRTATASPVTNTATATTTQVVTTATATTTQGATTATKRGRSLRQGADRRLQQRAADPPEEEIETPPERVIKTTSVARAALGALQIEVPTGEEVERSISQALVDLINRNRPRDEPMILSLPKLGAILTRMKVSTQW